MSKLTHIDETGRARMVDVSDKAATAREAVAEGFVRMAPRPWRWRSPASGKKGEVRAVAEIAGVMAAKRTSDLIPLCHPLALSKVEVRVEPAEGGLAVTARVKTTGPTGVEMEALTAVVGRLPDPLRHAEGRRQGHDHRGRAAGREDRRRVGRLPARREAA